MTATTTSAASHSAPSSGDGAEDALHTRAAVVPGTLAAADGCIVVMPVASEPAPSCTRSDTATQLPSHLRSLVDAIGALGKADLVYVAQMANTVAKRDVYSLLPYTGTNWYLPTVRACRVDEPHWQLRYDWRDGVTVALGGRRVSLRLLNIVLRLAFIVLVWFMLWCMLPVELVEPGGYVWDPVVLVVVSALVGGVVCRIVQLPPLIGVLWMGVLWSNVPRFGYLTAGIDTHVFDICAKLGLTVILLRAGYSISLQALRPHWKQSILLCTVTFACEGVAHSLIARPLFGYTSNHWAFLQGMLCSIASPAVVVPGALYLQEQGYGRGVSPLSLMLSAAGVEIVLGVWCANFIIGLIFAQQSLPVAIVLGPVQFVVGALLGVVFGIVFHYLVELLKKEATRLPNGQYAAAHLRRTLDRSFVLLLSASFTMVFLGYRVNLAGGGCVMTVFLAATIAHLWSGERGHAAPELATQKRLIARWLAVTWNALMMPILFAMMGARISVVAIFNRTFFPRALVCLVCSAAVRVVAIQLILLGSRFTWRERVVVSIGYLGKASAQASMGPIAAHLVAELVRNAPAADRGKYATMTTYAANVQQMSALYVMFMAAIGSIGLVHAGRRLLPHDYGNAAAAASTTTTMTTATTPDDAALTTMPVAQSVTHNDHCSKKGSPSGPATASGADAAQHAAAT